jgi:leader peptidase (prepilin peptidase) / N-methyltransferase
VWLPARGDSRGAGMPADPIEIRRIDVDSETSVWVPLKPPAEPAPAAPSPPSVPAPAWRVRPAGVTLGAVLAVTALLRLGLTAHAVLAAGLLAVLGMLAVIDLESRVLPNRIIGPATVGVLAFQTVLFPERLAECLIAALGAALLLLLPTLFHRGAMGMGDVKLAGLLGAALGGDVLVALMVGSLASVPAALVMLLRGSSLRGATLPLGPFLAVGAIVTLLA